MTDDETSRETPSPNPSEPPQSAQLRELLGEVDAMLDTFEARLGQQPTRFAHVDMSGYDDSPLDLTDGRDVEARRVIEAVLMVADSPTPAEIFAQLLSMTPDRIDRLAGSLRDEYDDGGRGFMLAKVAGGYRLQSHPDLAGYIERLVLEGQSARMSSAALETLAIVAYKQPISRGQVSAIRGVSVDGVMRTLQQRGVIAEVGRDHGPGQAVLYGTTQAFLERLGLDTLEELPPLGEFVPDPEIVEALEAGLRSGVSQTDRIAPSTEIDASPASEADATKVQIDD